MSALVQGFGFGEQLVRVVDRSGEVWFVGKDVCSALEIGNHNDALARLDDDERDGVGITDPIGREQQTTIVSESGMYSLVFTSRKGAAKAFRKWVTQEVLPAIRRTGRFEIGVNDDDGAPVVSDREDFERLKTGLALVREARMAFGRPAAQRAWLWAGLPEVDPDRLRERMIADGRINDEVAAEWFAARVEHQPGARVLTLELYRDFERWCVVNDRTPVTVTAFGRYLGKAGVISFRDNEGRRVRSGIRLRTEV